MSVKWKCILLLLVIIFTFVVILLNVLKYTKIVNGNEENPDISHGTAKAYLVLNCILLAIVSLYMVYMILKLIRSGAVIERAKSLYKGLPKISMPKNFKFSNPFKNLSNPFKSTVAVKIPESIQKSLVQLQLADAPKYMDSLFCQN